MRQGNPLSPLLFALAQQVLSSNLMIRIAYTLITSYKVGPNELHNSHIFCADDVSVFINDSESSFKHSM